MPSADVYVSMFAWDSGWHAIGLVHLDPSLAAAEIETLLETQRLNGQVPHEVLFDELNERASIGRRAIIALVRKQFDENQRSYFVDPPSFMIAAERVYKATGDRQWLERIIGKLEKCASYFTRDRDLFGDGLVSIIHPWESGTDTSPVFDEPMGIKKLSSYTAAKRLFLYAGSLNRLADMDWDMNRIREENRFVFEDLTMNSITIRGIVSLSRLFHSLGRKEKSAQYMKQARDMADALVRVSWDENEGCFFPRWDIENTRIVKRTTCASMLPMLSGLLDKNIADRIVREHFENPSEFNLPYVLAFNAKDELDLEGDIPLENMMLWRGHCIWTNMNWMMNEALLEYGYNDLARELTRRTVKMVRHEGFREFYDTRTGRGGGATNFCWPALVLDMIARSWPEVID